MCSTGLCVDGWGTLALRDRQENQINVLFVLGLAVAVPEPQLPRICLVDFRFKIT